MDMGERNEYTLAKCESHWNLLNKLFPLTRPPLQLLNNIKSTRKIKAVWDSRSLLVSRVHGCIVPVWREKQITEGFYYLNKTK